MLQFCDLFKVEISADRKFKTAEKLGWLRMDESFFFFLCSEGVVVPNSQTKELPLVHCLITVSYQMQAIFTVPVLRVRQR